jgi:NAD(P)-dependent dehydrogenase (short-subunit alcohol dehydrogenase family)
MKNKKDVSETIPPQTQNHQPGVETEMVPQPVSQPKLDARTGRLQHKVAIITGGDSGIGKAVALDFAKEGATVAIVYLEEDTDAADTEKEILAIGGKVRLFKGDVREESFCKQVAVSTLEQFDAIDIVVNNAAVQFEQTEPTDITAAQLRLTFETNVFAAFYLSLACLPHMKKGSSIINTTSVTAYRGSDHLIDYASTKAALVGFTRSLSSALAEKGIRVNAVAPGPIWTPLIPASFSEKEVAEFGKNTPMKRPGQPNEVAPCYTFLASEEASYITGQVLHPNGGEIING